MSREVKELRKFVSEGNSIASCIKRGFNLSALVHVFSPEDLINHGFKAGELHKNGITLYKLYLLSFTKRGIRNKSIRLPKLVKLGFNIKKILGVGGSFSAKEIVPYLFISLKDRQTNPDQLISMGLSKEVMFASENPAKYVEPHVKYRKFNTVAFTFVSFLKQMGFQPHQIYKMGFNLRELRGGGDFDIKAARYYGFSKEEVIEAKYTSQEILEVEKHFAKAKHIWFPSGKKFKKATSSQWD